MYFFKISISILPPKLGRTVLIEGGILSVPSLSKEVGCWGILNDLSTSWILGLLRSLPSFWCKLEQLNSCSASHGLLWSYPFPWPPLQASESSVEEHVKGHFNSIMWRELSYILYSTRIVKKQPLCCWELTELCYTSPLKACVGWNKILCVNIT